MEGIGAQMHIDLVKHSFDATIGFFINGKSLVYFETHTLSQIKPVIVED